MSNKLFRAHRLSDLPAQSDKLQNPYVANERRPRDTPVELHSLTNNWFEKQFGLRFRSRTLFCSGNKEMAREYCDENHGLISIRPVGEFKLCYSPNCADLYRHFQRVGSHPWKQDEVWAQLESLDYQILENDSWDFAAASGCEIMIYSEQFIYRREDN